MYKSEAEYVMSSTNRERGNIARSAKYKRNGSKSTKCPMSTDNMTRKEWEKHNGEVVAYNLSKPMDWKSFKRLSPAKQAEYLRRLADRFNASSARIATDLFNIGKSTLASHIFVAENKDDYAFFSERHRIMNKTQEEAWIRWVCQEPEEKPEPEPEVKEEPAPVAETPAPAETTKVSFAPMMSDVDRFDTTFGGDIVLAEIFVKLKMMFGDNLSGKLRISYERG